MARVRSISWWRRSGGAVLRFLERVAMALRIPVRGTFAGGLMAADIPPRKIRGRRQRRLPSARREIFLPELAPDGWKGRPPASWRMMWPRGPPGEPGQLDPVVTGQTPGEGRDRRPAGRGSDEEDAAGQFPGMGAAGWRSVRGWMAPAPSTGPRRRPRPRESFRSMASGARRSPPPRSAPRPHASLPKCFRGRRRQALPPPCWPCQSRFQDGVPGVTAVPSGTSQRRSSLRSALTGLGHENWRFGASARPSVQSPWYAIAGPISLRANYYWKTVSAW